MENTLQQQVTTAINPLNPYIIRGSELALQAKEIVIDSRDKVEDARTILKSCQATEKEIEEKRTEIVKPYNDLVKEVNAYAKTLLQPTEAAKSEIKGKILARDQEQERIKQAEAMAVNNMIIKIQKTATIDELETIRQEVEAAGAVHERIATAILNQFKAINEAEEAKKRQEEADRLRQLAATGDKVAVAQEAQNIVAAREERADEVAATAQEIAVTPTIQEDDSKVKGIRYRYSYEIEDANLIPRAYLTIDDKKVREAIKTLPSIPGIKIIKTKDIQ